MRVLHLLSNRKWTERAEPAADLAVAEQAQGAEVAFGCAAAADGTESQVAVQAARKGLACVVMLPLPKHLNLLRVPFDAWRLRAFMRDWRPDVVHCHMENAHLLAGVARWPGRRPPIVWSFYDVDADAAGPLSRWRLRHWTDGLVALSAAPGERLARRHGLPAERVTVSEPGIDLARFDPGRHVAGGREAFGLPADAFVIGVVSRIREARRLDLALSALQRLSRTFPQVRLLVVGRGRKGAVEKVVEEPARRMGIADRVTLAGYCRDDALVVAYRAMDVLVYPAPGTDKSCRTVREAMAAGVPVVAPAQGFLTELIDDGVNGRLTGPSPEELADVLSPLIADPDAARALGQGARDASVRRFDPRRRAQAMLRFYSELIDG